MLPHDTPPHQTYEICCYLLPLDHLDNVPCSNVCLCCLLYFMFYLGLYIIL